MSYESVVLADSPKLYYRLGQTTSTMTDSSGSGLAGTVVGSPERGITGLLTGDADSAIKFNAANQEVSRAHNALLNVADTFTFEAWIKVTAIAGGQHCICFKIGGSNTTAKFVVLAEGKLQLRVPGKANIITGKTVLVAGVIYHVVVVKSGSTRKLYVNGVDDTGALEEFTCKNNEGTLHLGVEEPGEGENFNGVLDEFAYYSTALSEARVKAHYEAGLAAPSLGMLI